jgi:hypothetical protein
MKKKTFWLAKVFNLYFGLIKSLTLPQAGC